MRDKTEGDNEKQERRKKRKQIEKKKKCAYVHTELYCC